MVDGPAPHQPQEGDEPANIVDREDEATDPGGETHSPKRGRGGGGKIASQQRLDNLDSIRQARNAAKTQLKELRKRYKKDRT